MKKECFTCNNKITTELPNDKLEFHCKVTGKKIRQIDPACDEYDGDNFMEDIRMEIAKTARKLRKEL